MTPELDNLLGWMRRNGVMHVKLDGIELTISPDALISEEELGDAVPTKVDRESSTYLNPLDDPAAYGDGHVPELAARGKK